MFGHGSPHRRERGDLIRQLTDLTQHSRWLGGKIQCVTANLDPRPPQHVPHSLAVTLGVDEMPVQRERRRPSTRDPAAIGLGPTRRTGSSPEARPAPRIRRPASHRAPWSRTPRGQVDVAASIGGEQLTSGGEAGYWYGSMSLPATAMPICRWRTSRLLRVAAVRCGTCSWPPFWPHGTQSASGSGGRPHRGMPAWTACLAIPKMAPSW